jgi:hypothetical protein
VRLTFYATHQKVNINNSRERALSKKENLAVRMEEFGFHMRNCMEAILFTAKKGLSIDASIGAREMFCSKGVYAKACNRQSIQSSNNNIN